MNNYIRITAPNDSRIPNYCQVKERDLVGRDGLFVAEGEVVLRVLIESTLMQTISVLIDEKREQALAPTLSKLQPEVPIYLASQNVMDAIVGFHIHRGILAIGRRKVLASACDLLSTLPERATVLGLVGIANHDNMGGIFRNAAAFGVNAVILDDQCCDPLYRKAIRVSVGAAFCVPFAKIFKSDGMLSLFRQQNLATYALTPSGNTPLRDLRRPGRVAVLLGAEGTGLPSEMMQQCESVSIPMAQGFDSLNVATTSGIVLHHFLNPSDKHQYK